MSAVSPNAVQVAIWTNCATCGAPLRVRRAGVRYCTPCGRAARAPQNRVRARARLARQRFEQALLVVDRGWSERVALRPEQRPRTRAECENGLRPCPWVSCRYHLYLDVDRSGVLRRQPGDPLDLRETCALDVADRGPLSDADVGRLLGITRSGVAVIAERALVRLRRRKDLDE